MAYREVKVHDDPFPTHEQILSGDPAAPPFPKEAWLQKVNPGEFAVRYKDFKSRLARNPQGQHVQASEICRVFDNLAEARGHSLQITKEHWTVRCFIYDHSGAQIDSVSNAARVSKFALAMYAGILLWATLYTVAGYGADLGCLSWHALSAGARRQYGLLPELARVVFAGGGRGGHRNICLVYEITAHCGSQSKESARELYARGDEKV